VAYTAGTLARAPYAAGSGTETPPPPGQQTIPPPIPGGTATFIYEAPRILTLGWRSYAGRTGPLIYPGGGVSIAPIPDRGVMSVSGWWPDATILQFLRQHQDGSLHPVRTAAPLNVTTETRRNYATNPSLEVGLNGYVAGTGTPTLSTIAGNRGSNAIRATIASAGSCGLTIPNALPGGRDITEGLDLRFSATPSSVTLQIGWVDALGVATPTSSVVLTANQVNQSVGQWGRQVAGIPTPANGVTANVVIVAAGLPAGATMDVDGVTLERGTTDGSFFDGAFVNGQWLGTAGLSASVLAPMISLEDGECPTDMPVQYIVINPAATGGRMTSAPAVLESRGVTWLTHPSAPTAPRKVFVKETPDLLRAARQGFHQAIGAATVTVVSARQRTAPSGEIKLWTFSFADRDALLDLLDDQSPVLLRPPQDFGYSDGMWISLGSLLESPDGTADWQHYRLLTAPFVSTEAPL
jgi:hypothetical protein